LAVLAKELSGPVPVWERRLSSWSARWRKRRWTYGLRQPVREQPRPQGMRAKLFFRRAAPDWEEGKEEERSPVLEPLPGWKGRLRVF
jgi:hypothetical protein